MNRKLDQHTFFNCYDPYCPELAGEESELSPRVQEYLNALRHFEGLYARYRASTDVKIQTQAEVFLKVKNQTHSYALSAKGPWLGMVSMPNNQMVSRGIEEILSEKMVVCKENLDHSFHLKQF